MFEKKKLDKPLHPEDMIIPSYSVFIGRVYLQHEELSLRSSHSLSCNTYLIRFTYTLDDSVAFAYRAGVRVDKKPATGLRKKL